MSGRAADVIQLIREALSNVGRHAQAATCRVSLIRTTDGALLEVDDNGQGFDLEAAKGKGHGLRNLEERAQSLAANSRS
jgi:signal transduction histidine kinase